jgi:glycosyltransferase involved in cell wall biosynthesis
MRVVHVNHGSTDGTASIVDSYQRTEPGVRVYHQENRGLLWHLN